MTPYRLPALSLAALCLCTACATTPTTYGAGQAWQRNECQRIEDRQARQRCLAQADTPIETYRRDSERAKGGQ